MESNVIIYSYPRSGSTVAWQIAKLLTGKHPDKSHTNVINDPSKKTIVAIRNPIYSISSLVRLDYDIDKSVDELLEWSDEYNKLNKAGLLILRYEDYLDDPISRIYEISVYLHINGDFDSIHKQTSINNNKITSDLLEDFSKYDKDNYIHGNHISNPFNDSNLIPERLMDKIKTIAKNLNYELFTS